MKARRPSLFLLAAICALAYGTSSARAQSYHPLEIGWHWMYISETEGAQTMTIVGERDVFGVTTRVRLQVQEDQTYENYWTETESGDLFLHGGHNITNDVGWLYSPPIKMVSAPLFLGKAWTTEGVLFYGLDGTPSGEPIDYPLIVYTAGTLTVPAGEFDAFGVGFDASAFPFVSRAGRSYDIFGRALAPVTAKIEGTPTDWYAQDVGEVQMNTTVDETCAFKLVSYGPSVAVHASTWGRVKNTYR